MPRIKMWEMSETRKELDEVRSRFCKKLMGLPNCAVNGFAEMELDRESGKGKYIGQIVKYSNRIMCMDREDPAKQCYEWPTSNKNVSSRTMELKEEVYNIG
jgi:hypothetical protein